MDFKFTRAKADGDAFVNTCFTGKSISIYAEMRRKKHPKGPVDDLGGGKSAVLSSLWTQYLSESSVVQLQ